MVKLKALRIKRFSVQGLTGQVRRSK